MNLKFIIPNGSLSSRLKEFLQVAGYSVQEPDRTGFCGTVNNVEFFQLDRRMVPYFVQTDRFDAGITGYDLLVASGLSNSLMCTAELNFSRATNQPTRWVLVCRDGYNWRKHKERPARIACELPGLAKRLLKRADLPFKYKIEKIEGSEEQCVANGMVDLAVIVTETGKSIQANKLEVFPGCERMLVSTPRVISKNTLGQEQRDELLALTSALQAVVAAQAFVMVTFNFPSDLNLSGLGLPAEIAPTVSPLTKTGWSAGQVCIPRTEIGRVAVRLRRAGATGTEIIGLQGHL